MSGTEPPAHLNSRPVILPEDGFTCPPVPAFIDVFGRTRPNFVRAEDRRIGVNVQVGDSVALKDGRRVLQCCSEQDGTVGSSGGGEGCRTNVTVLGQAEVVVKKRGPRRTVLVVQDYRSGQFDESANRVVRGSRAPCTVLPAIRTARFLSIPEGRFSVEGGVEPA